MIVLGLTGSIGMGKTATARLFAEAGVPVYDADAAVHELYARGGAAVAPLSEAFGGVLRDGAIDRAALRSRVVGNAAAMARLEAIVHPLAGASQRRFRAAAETAGEPFVVLDIPLLFETGGDKACDLVCVVTAPAETQRARVLARPDMTEETLSAILDRQVPDAEKRARADLVVMTGYGFDFARAQVEAIVGLLHRLAAPQGSGE